MNLLLVTVAVCMALLCGTNARLTKCQEGALLYSADLSLPPPPEPLDEAEIEGFVVTPEVQLYTTGDSDYAKGITRITFPEEVTGIQNRALQVVLEFDERAVKGTSIHISDSTSAPAKIAQAPEFAEIFNVDRDLWVQTRVQEDELNQPEEKFITQKMYFVIGDEYVRITNDFAEREYSSTGLFHLRGQQSGSYDILFATNRAIDDATASLANDGLKRIEIYAMTCDAN